MSVLRAITVKSFSKQLPLSGEVLSDHPELGVILKNRKNSNETIEMIFWNISNPKCHNYFENGPFYETHMFFKEPYINSKLIPELRNKINKQLEIISNRFLKNGIEIIIEGYPAFFDELITTISMKKKYDFEVITTIDDKSESINTTWNIIGMIIDLKRFKIISKTIQSMKYIEHSGCKPKSLTIPIVKLQDKISKIKFIIVPVHISGCDSQFPISGLSKLRSILLNLQRDCDIICAGDFNTERECIQSAIVNNINDCFILDLPWKYSHVNPYNQALNMDHAIIMRANDNGMDYKCEDIKNLSTSTIELVNSIDNLVKNS